MDDRRFPPDKSIKEGAFTDVGAANDRHNGQWRRHFRGFNDLDVGLLVVTI
jgi:hypothetical protein